MDLDFDLSSRAKEVDQPQLPPSLQEFTKSAEEISNSLPRFIGVLNTMSDAHTEGYCSRKRIRLALDGRESCEESTLLGSAGSDTAELANTFDNFNFPAKAMESMIGQSNVALCHVMEKATRLASTKPVNFCAEEQDYIGSINLVQDYLDKIKNIVKTGDTEDVLNAAVSAMKHVTDMLTSMSSSSALAHSRL